MDNSKLVVFSRPRAAKLSGLTQRQLDYWRSTGFVVPQVDRRLSAARPVVHYSYTDMLALLVVAELRKRKVSLQRIRRVVADLHQRGYADPLTQVVFGTAEQSSDKLEVFFKLADGTWEGDRSPGQMVFHEVLDLDTIRTRVRRAAVRDEDTVGAIESRRGTMGNKPLIAGTRIPVATVREYLKHGVSTAEIIEAFPSLRPTDVDTVRALSA
jgi:uncharacterized protein (DUF433 family)